VVQVGKFEVQNPQAYEYYLRAKNAYENHRGPGDIQVAESLYTRALDLDGTMLVARAGLAQMQLDRADYEAADREIRKALAISRERDQSADEAILLRLLAPTAQSLWTSVAHGEEASALPVSMRLAGSGSDRRSGRGPGKRARFDEALPLFQRVLEISGRSTTGRKRPELCAAWARALPQRAKCSHARCSPKHWTSHGDGARIRDRQPQPGRYLLPRARSGRQAFRTGARDLYPAG
jgi:tetratricopeptide (TPR) repeat protein